MSDENRIFDLITGDCPKLIINRSGKLCSISKHLLPLIYPAPDGAGTISVITDTPSDFLETGTRQVYIRGREHAVTISVEELDSEHLCIGFTDLCENYCEQLNLMQLVYQSIICGVMIFSIEYNPRIINFNDKTLAILGCPDRSSCNIMLNKNIFLPVYLPDLEIAQKRISECISSDDDVGFELRVDRHNGTIGWIKGLLRKIDYGGTLAIQCSFTDITEQKDNEQRLIISEERFRMAISQVGMNVWEYYPSNGSQLFFNVCENTNKSGRLCIADESLSEYKRVHDEIDKGASGATCTVKIKSHASTPQWCRITYKAYFDENGKTTKAIGISEDISELKFNEEKYLSEIKFMHNIANAVLSSCRINITKNRVEAFRADETIDINYTEGMRYDVFCERIMINVENPEEHDQAMNAICRDSLLAHFKNGDSYVKITYRRRRTNGSFFWVETTIRLMREPETGDIIGFAYARDCSYVSNATTRSERMLMNFKKAADSTYYFVMSLDYTKSEYDFIQLSEKSAGTGIPLSGKISDFIRLAGLLFGEGFSEMAVTIATYDALMKSMNENKELVFEIYSDSGCGMHWFEHRIVRASDDPDEKLFLILTVIIDNVKRREEVLRRALENANLARKAKRDFITHMSREIRTPLNGITGMLDLLKENPDLQENSYLKNAIVSSNQLAYLMSDILDMTALENGRITLEDRLLTKNEFDSFIRSIIQPLADKKKIIFNVSFGSSYYPDIICDGGRLMQIVVNLLTNAVKFTNEGGTVGFSIVTGERHSDSIFADFIVTDTGIGMSEEFLSHASEAFDREDMTGNEEGTGLGLAIVKRLTELMGGKLTIESELGHGTTVTVSLRLRLAAENDIRGHLHGRDTTGGTLPDFAGKHALVVEDNRLSMEIAEHQLRSLHFIVDKAGNGLEAVQAFDNSYCGYYDIMFMDIVMPKCDGLSATRTIRLMDREDAKTVPIVAMTANAFPEDACKSFESGMNYHITKPLNPKDIKEILLREFGK